MTSPFAQNKDAASTVFSTVDLGKRVALTSRRLVVWLSEVQAIVARVTCVLESRIEPLPGASSLLDEVAGVASTLAPMAPALSRVAAELVEASAAGDVNAESALALLSHCSKVDTLLSAVSPAAVAHAFASVSPSLAAGGPVSSTANHASSTADTITLQSRAQKD